MNQEEFINALKITVVDSSINAMKSDLIQPPGRQPSKKLVILSEWYNKLEEVEKEYVLDIVRESVEMSVFGFFCVLDGVSAIEDVEDKGKLLLYYEKEGIKTLLNDPNDNFLHDLFSSS